MNQQRLECERLIYKIMEILDDPKKNGDTPNVDFWVEYFSTLNDKQFEEFVTRPLSLCQEQAERPSHSQSATAFRAQGTTLW